MKCPTPQNSGEACAFSKLLRYKAIGATVYRYDRHGSLHGVWHDICLYLGNETWQHESRCSRLSQTRSRAAGGQLLLPSSTRKGVSTYDEQDLRYPTLH